MHERSTATESQLCCVFLFYLPWSGGERSGVEPHCTAHSAAPQVRAGHCPCGGQHLRVLQWSLNLPVSSVFCRLFLLLTAAFLPPTWLLENVGHQGVSLHKCHYYLLTVPSVKSGRAKDFNLPLKLYTMWGVPPLIWECQAVFPNLSWWWDQMSSLAQPCFRGEGVGARRFFLDLFTVIGTHPQPWWQSYRTEPFSEGNEPMMHCTVL